MTRRTFAASTAASALRGQNRQSAMFSNAEAYEQFMGRWSRLVAPLLVRFAAVPELGRVLDIGSGTGALAFEIAKQRTGVHVTGIDPSREYVAFATNQNRSPERVAFQQGDAQRMNFPDQTFVASVSLLVFNFIPDAAKALQEARRVTRAKERISAAVWDYGDRMVMLRTFWDAAIEIDPRAEKVDEKHMPLCRPGDLSRLWKKVGLANVHEEPLETEIPFRSFSDYWQPFLLGQGPAGAWVRTLPEDRMQALQSALKRRLKVGVEDKAFVLPARVWAVRGEVSHSDTA